MNGMISVLSLPARVGRRTRLVLLTTGQFSQFAVRAFRAILQIPTHNLVAEWVILQRQLRYTGLLALPTIFILSAIIGSVVITQALPTLQGVGAADLVGKILVIAIVRELGPLLTALILIGRSGTAVAAELGTNKIMRETEALECMGIDPITYLVAPRVLAFVIASVCLTLYFDVTAILGGFLVASLQMELSFSAFTDVILEAVSTRDLVVSFLKSVLFGFVISIICCYNGLSARRATTEVPIVTSKGVVESIIVVFLISGTVSFLFYL